jgi:mono/diheme cytochrome c family protein
MTPTLTLFAPILFAHTLASHAVPQRGAEVFAQYCANPQCRGSEDRLPETGIAAVTALVASLRTVLPPAFAQSGGEIPEQAERGRKLFFESTKGTPCGNCHQLQGKGTAIGPDLTRLARVHPRAVVTAIRSSRTQYVKSVAVRGTRGTFPGMPVTEEGPVLKYYDLSKNPPELRTIQRTELQSATDNATWKHPPESVDYTPEELADIIAYIRYAGFGDTKGVKPSDVQ